MAPAPRGDWQKEFGLHRRPPRDFFASKADIDSVGDRLRQPQVLQRAFEQLRLGGILVQDDVPLIYFREVAGTDSPEIEHVLDLFWNQGVAPILVLIAPDEVHVHSSLVRPERTTAEGRRTSGFVEALNRVADELQAFVLSVESGDYFRVHRRSFDPDQRVDRLLLRNLKEARAQLDKEPERRLGPKVLDALLCRLVFTCYLFDRGVIDAAYLEEIGIHGARHLSDILGLQPRLQAKVHLYHLFAQLGKDFNGDLFSDDLEDEARQVRVEHLDILHQFFVSTDLVSGQTSFLHYNFGIIPIETVSSIYEQFLKLTDAKKKKESGAFFTPRFLAELVLDLALKETSLLLDKRFLDPACGSGIFLVGLFNRLAYEWSRENPKARYDAQATRLMRLLTQNLYGIDRNPTACRITAFSLYLAFLDQLAPPDIRQLQRKGKVLPRLVGTPGSEPGECTILCADFFSSRAMLEHRFDLIVGNPPWGSEADPAAPVAAWVAEHKCPFPDRQNATAFIWKAPDHLAAGGRVCFVLPYGTVFNRNAIAFQREWLQRHTVDLVLNLADYQRFLFEEAGHPALVVRYAKEAPPGLEHRIDYWVPKSDWGAFQAEVIPLLPMDRSRLPLREVLDYLADDAAPLIWKERSWATPRDRRLLDRLSLLPRLGDLVGSPGEPKRWIISEGFQPPGASDDPEDVRILNLPSKFRIEARSKAIDLFLLPSDCEQKDRSVRVRNGSNTNVTVFRKPHVLITKGFSRIAFADFDVSFRHAVRGVHGPDKDREFLVFLTTYLRSPLARFFLFHTSSNWGVSRAEVHVDELRRLPFPLPEEAHAPKRCRQIVREVAQIVSEAMSQARYRSVDRHRIVTDAAAITDKLVLEYFDIDELELMLVIDTNKLTIPSARPTRKRRADVPTLRPSNELDRDSYAKLLRETLNEWSSSEFEIHAEPMARQDLGLGLIALEKTRRGQLPARLKQSTDLLAILKRLQQGVAKGCSTIELVRGVKVFDGPLLYVTKPLGQRFWSRTAALNDADEIARTVLMKSTRAHA